MYRMYAADPRARINLVIRRRLAPLMENDLDRIKLMNSLLLSMPGSPIIYYGDEIGMGDNIFLGDRNGVRTPMQWSPDRNAGFSRADPQRLFLPAIQDPIYGFEAVNVEAQARDPGSLLNWMRRMLAVRKTSRAFGRGKLTFLRAGNRKILAYLRELGDEAILCVANLGRSAQPVELDLKRYRGRVPVELLGRTPFPPVGDLPYLLTLPAHGFYWFRLAADVPVPHWHEEFLSRDEAPVLVLFDSWKSLFPERVVPWRIGLAEKARRQFEAEIVPRFVETQRWYAAKGETVTRATLVEHALWKSDQQEWLLGLFDVKAQGEPSRYFAPLALAWEDHDEERVKALAPATLARVRQQAKVGVMADAFADEPFVRALVGAVHANLELPAGGGRIRFAATRAFEEILAGDDPAALPVVRTSAQTSNTGVSLGSRLFVKGYRRVRTGINPEFEVGRYLTEVARFANCVPVAGVVEHVTSEGETTTLALLQAYCSNQGDGWGHTLEYLERFVESRRTVTEPPAVDAHGAYLALVHTLGLRTGELHAALAQRHGEPAFDPEPLTDADIAAWRGGVLKEALDTLALLERHRGEMPSPARDEARTLLIEREALVSRIEGAGRGGGATLKTRYHGDYHLGQVLLSKNDFLITDFEGEPARSLEERRAKHCALRDVAGMLRSFSYARWTAAKQANSMDPARDGRLEALLAQWERETRREFLQAYEQAVGGSGLYGSFPAARGLLELFELEKALYELRYEINNRPGWVRIPLQGILALAGGGLAGH